MLNGLVVGQLRIFLPLVVKHVKLSPAADDALVPRRRRKAGQVIGALSLRAERLHAAKVANVPHLRQRRRAPLSVTGAPLPRGTSGGARTLKVALWSAVII